MLEFSGISVAISKHYQCTSMCIGQVLLSTQPCEQSNWPIYCSISQKMAEILYGHCVCDTITGTTICGRKKLCHNFLYTRHTARNIFSSILQSLCKAYFAAKRTIEFFLVNF